MKTKVERRKRKGQFDRNKNMFKTFEGEVRTPCQNTWQGMC